MSAGFETAGFVPPGFMAEESAVGIQRDEAHDSLMPASGVGLAAPTLPPPTTLVDSSHADLTNAGVTLRVIKRYSNRKLYDTKSSRYVTLPQIAELVRAGERVQIVDNRTKEDKTEITLALIISEELRVSPRGIPLGTLTALIKHSSDEHWPLEADHLGALIRKSELVGGPVSDSRDTELRARFEQWCAAVDSRMRSLADLSKISTLEAEIHRLNDRLAKLERNITSSRE